jgi:hypothetical protein
MRTFSQQLAAVGFQPTFQPSPSTPSREFASVRASNRNISEPKSLEAVLDGLIEPLIKPRKVRRVLITRAGGHYRARYEGASDSAFGSNPHEASGRVKLFGQGNSKQSPVFEKEEVYV